MSELTLPFLADSIATPAFRPGTPVLQHISPPDFLLRRGAIAGHPDVWSLDLGNASGCGCPFGPERQKSTDSAVPTVHLFNRVSSRLESELAWRQPLPRVVQIGTSLDPFLDVPGLQAEVLRVVRVLAERGIKSWLGTRGRITASVAEQLSEYRDCVRVSVSVMSPVPKIQQVLEPFAASTEERLQTVVDLRQHGIPVEVNLDPLLPNLTDTHEPLQELLELIADSGVTCITAGYLILRPGMHEELEAILEPPGWSELVMSAYADGIRIRSASQPAALYLAKARRQRGYASLMSLAANVGITVRLCSQSNPDFLPAKPVPCTRRLMPT